MRLLFTFAPFAPAAIALAVATLACGGSSPPAAAPSAAVASAPSSAPVSAAPATASSGPLATPGPAALPCTSDAECMTFRCNTQAGKCAMPCEHDSDCVAGAYCLNGVIPACVARHATTP